MPPRPPLVIPSPPAAQMGTMRVFETTAHTGHDDDIHHNCWLACRDGDSKTVARLAAAGARPDVSLEDEGGCGVSALLIACHEGHSAVLAALAAEPSCGAERVGQPLLPNGATALHIACHQGHLELACWLLDSLPGCDPNRSTSEGHTPLFIAAHRCVDYSHPSSLYGSKSLMLWCVAVKLPCIGTQSSQLLR
eukprot:SAG11_NODE_2290_length_3558_cov_2.262215_5_plen_193_part_00